MGCAASKSDAIDKKLPTGRLEADAAPEPAPEKAEAAEAADATAAPAPSVTTPEKEKIYSRDGLHSAPTRRSPAPGSTPADATADVAGTPAAEKEDGVQPSESPGKQHRIGLHSAPPLKRLPGAGPAAEATKEPEPFELVQGLDEFIIEKPSGRSASEVDAYLADIISQPTARNLRSTQWAERVQGLEEVKARLTASRRVAVPEQLAVFKACVTVLARLLQDRVVPVYLPALELLVDLFHDEHLAALPPHLGRAAVALTCDQMVLRCGSSNGRARDESIDAVFHCARSHALGPQAVAPHVLKPLANVKSSQAAIGRLELLHRLVIKFGFVRSSGLTHERVVAFAAPLCHSAAEKAREAAFALLKEARLADPAATSAILAASHPTLAAALDPKPERASDVKARRALPPIGTRPSAGAAFLQGDKADMVVVGKAPPAAGAGGGGASAPPPRTFLAPPTKGRQVVPSVPFEEPLAPQPPDGGAKGVTLTGSLVDSQENVEPLNVQQSPPSSLRVSGAGVGLSSRKSSLRSKSLLHMDASPEAAASTPNAALSKATKRVRIAPVAGGGGDDDLDNEELLAELQAEMLALE